MKGFINIFFIVLCICGALSVSAQQNTAKEIVGIWSTPYKTASQQGSLIIEFKSDHNVKITRSVTVEHTAHAAFNQISGTWRVNNSVLSIIPESTEGKFKWTNLIGQQILLDEIPKYYADELLASAKQKLPKLNDLHFASKLQVKQVTESKLILLNVKDSKSLTFTRISAYPKGGRLKVKLKQTEETIASTSSNENQTNGNADSRYEIIDEVKPQVSEEKEPNNSNSEKIYFAVEESPRFPGGDAELYKWLSKNIHYPEMAGKNNIQGRVTVQFVVETDGSVGEVKVLRGKDPDLDKEAVRLVKSLPKFIPGNMNGQSVRVWYTLSINFKIAD